MEIISEEQAHIAINKIILDVSIIIHPSIDKCIGSRLITDDLRDLIRRSIISNHSISSNIILRTFIKRICVFLEKNKFHILCDPNKIHDLQLKKDSDLIIKLAEDERKMKYNIEGLSNIQSKDLYRLKVSQEFINFYDYARKSLISYCYSIIRKVLIGHPKYSIANLINEEGIQDTIERTMDEYCEIKAMEAVKNIQEEFYGVERN